METSIQKYLEKPVQLLREAGILEKSRDSQLVGLLSEVQYIDEPKILAIASAVRYVDSFNDFINENTKAMNVSDRYNDITARFESIREDAKTLLKHAEDNKIGIGEQLQQFWMKLSRGSIPNRINQIGNIYNEVCNDVRTQVQRESNVLEAYKDFRAAIKEAEVISYDVLKTQKSNVERSQAKLKSSNESLASYKREDQAEKAKLELARDNGIREAKAEQAKHKLLEDIAQNLKASYEVGEVLVQKIEQTNEAKRAIYTKSVAFFGTNKQILSTMGLAYIAEQGIHEMTEATRGMSDEMNKSLEDLAELGKVDLEATRLAYDSIYKPESVKKLVDAINQYETEVSKTIIETRKKAAKDIAQISEIVEEGKNTRVKIVSDFISQKIE